MDTVKQLQLRVGGMCGIPGQTCLISKKNREALGIDVDVVVRIESVDQGTAISRRVLKAPKVCSEKDQFVFLSPEDIELLNTNIAENVVLTLDPVGLECP